MSALRNKKAARSRGLRVGLAWLCLAVVAGCAEQRIRERSQNELAAGDYEQAVHDLADGLKEHPDSTTLRSGLIEARTEAITRLQSNAQALQAAGKLDEAQKLLRRAQALDPQNERVAALLAELDIQRRQDAALAEANDWVAKKHPEAALRVIEDALKDNPHHAGLLALQHRLALEQREAQLRASQTSLAETRPISLDFRDAGLRTVLDVVSRNSGVNFVIDKDVRPETRVTVYLKQARVEDALNLILTTNQLAKKVIDARTIIIYPNTPDKQREYQDQVVRVFYLASADAKGAASFLKSMLKIHEPFVDERSNMLALRDSPENIELAERLIGLYDTGDPEVLLDVEVLEINANRLTDLGITYPDSFSLTPLAPDGSDKLTLGNVRGMNRDRIGLGISGLLVNLKRQVGDFTTLANPRIRVRNKEKASIMVGDKVPVVTSTTGQTGFVSDSVNYLDVGLKLGVEPTVYADDDVSIKVDLEVSSLGSAIKTASGTQAYQIGTRNASTRLRLHDGETQLLGGLISRDDSSNASRIPGLGDLPVLGRLFSDQQDSSNHTELVLAITPHIMRNIRHPDATETELWVGTEDAPQLMPVGGLRALAAPSAVGGASNPAADAHTPASSGAGPAPAVDAGSAALSPSANAQPTASEAVVAPHLTWTGSSDVKVGDAVEAHLDIETLTALRGMPLQLWFSADKLQLTDASEGAFFKHDGAPTSFSKSGDGKDGKLNIGVLRNQATAIGGKGNVLTLYFEAIAKGTAEVRVLSAQAIGLGAPAPQPVLPQPLAVHIH
jgi:general secretion pathway protein D